MCSKVFQKINLNFENKFCAQHTVCLFCEKIYCMLRAEKANIWSDICGERLIIKIFF